MVLIIISGACLLDLERIAPDWGRGGRREEKGEGGGSEMRDGERERD